MLMSICFDHGQINRVTEADVETGRLTESKDDRDRRPFKLVHLEEGIGLDWVESKAPLC
jgi:hypothetical protein